MIPALDQNALTSAFARIKELESQRESLRAEVVELRRDKLDLIVDCERLATDLEQSLRQWNMYAEMREDEDLDTADHWEGEAYRACVKRAKDWRDKAAAVSSSEQAKP